MVTSVIVQKSRESSGVSLSSILTWRRAVGLNLVSAFLWLQDMFLATYRRCRPCPILEIISFASTYSGLSSLWLVGCCLVVPRPALVRTCTSLSIRSHHLHQTSLTFCPRPKHSRSIPTVWRSRGF